MSSSSTRSVFGLRRGLSSRLWDKTPASIDRSELTQPVQDAIIDEAKKNQDRRAAAKRASFEADNKLRLGKMSASKKGSKAAGDSSDLDLKQQQGQQLAALTNPDLLCDPLTEERGLFEEFNIVSLRDRLVEASESTNRGNNKEPARFAMTELKQEATIPRNLPKDIMVEGESAPSQPQQAFYWKFLDNVQRVPVGVSCTVQKGKYKIRAKNIPRSAISSQYYLHSIAFTLIAGPRSNSMLMEVGMESARGNEEIHWEVLNKPDDILYLNFSIPEEEKQEFEDVKSEVAYLNEKIRTLQEELLRVEASTHQQIGYYESRMRGRVSEALGSAGFVEVQGEITDCVLQGFDKTTGQWNQDNYFKCLNEAIRTQNLVKELNEIRNNRKRTRAEGKVLAPGGEWIDDEKVVIPPIFAPDGKMLISTPSGALSLVGASPASASGGGAAPLASGGASAAGGGGAGAGAAVPAGAGGTASALTDEEIAIL